MKDPIFESTVLPALCAVCAKIVAPRDLVAAVAVCGPCWEDLAEEVRQLRAALPSGHRLA